MAARSVEAEVCEVVGATWDIDKIGDLVDLRFGGKTPGGAAASEREGTKQTDAER